SELIARVALRVGQPSAPPSTGVEDVERVEARLVVVAVGDVERERREATRFIDVRVAVQRHLGERRERTGLTPAVTLLGGLSANPLHFLRDDGHVALPPRGAGRLIAALEC